MIYFEIKQKSGEIVASNLHKCPHILLFKDNPNAIFKDKNIKGSLLNQGNLSIFIIAQDEPDLLKSSKLFKKTLNIYGGLSSNFFEYYFSKIKVHSHTLRSIQGKMKQKIDSLVSKSDFNGKDYAESKSNIAKKIETNIDKTADVICYLNKRIGEIDAHIEGFDVLYMGDQLDTNIENVNIKKVLLNIFAPFLSDFNKKGVNTNFVIKDDYANANKIKLDYRMFNLALCNFFDNAIKYSKPYSPINITFTKGQNDKFELEISMMSLRIDQDELDLIFDEGYSGRHASHDAGDGIGMSVMKKALELTGMKIEIVPNYSESENINGRKYIMNTFKITSK